MNPWPLIQAPNNCSCLFSLLEIELSPPVHFIKICRWVITFPLSRVGFEPMTYVVKALFFSLLIHPSAWLKSQKLKKHLKSTSVGCLDHQIVSKNKINLQNNFAKRVFLLLIFQNIFFQKQVLDLKSRSWQILLSKCYVECLLLGRRDRLFQSRYFIQVLFVLHKQLKVYGAGN